MNSDTSDRRLDADNDFKVHHGPLLSSIKDLLDYLPDMSDEQFAFHVTPEKNDFAQWIADTRGPGSIAEIIRDATNRTELATALRSKLNEYEKREAVDDETFNRAKEQYAERNEKIQEKFDKIASDMQRAIDNEMPDATAKELESLYEKHNETRQRLSELRRKGKDTLLASLLLKQFKPKAMYAAATRDRADIEQARSLLGAVAEELDEAEKTEEIDVKKEVLAMAGGVRSGTVRKEGKEQG